MAVVIILSSDFRTQEFLIPVDLNHKLQPQNPKPNNLNSGPNSPNDVRQLYTATSLHKATERKAF